MADELSAGELTLRALHVSDASELHLIFSDPATHTIGEGPISDISDPRQWLLRRDERRRQYGVTWYGVRNENGTLIGNAGLFIGRTGIEPAIGFEIRSIDQREGYGTHADLGDCSPSNAASLRALTRAGFINDRTEDEERGGLAYLHHVRN